MTKKSTQQLLNSDELQAISKDMRTLFDSFRAGKCERADADTAANIAGKNLKAQQLITANAIYNDAVTHRVERTLLSGETAAQLAKNS